MDRLEELTIFVAIIEAGSLVGASRRLRRSPPAVTRALSALEDRIGLRLVERTTRRLAPTEALKSGGRGAAISDSQRLRSTLVVAEVAFAVMLVLSAGLLIRSFWAISHTNPGFKTEHVVTARITPNESFCSDAARCVAFYRSVVSQAQASPGVSAAALVNTLPLGGRVSKRTMDVENHVAAPGENAPLFWLNAVTPDYFKVMGIGALAGREFNAADEAANTVAVVTAATARRYWPGESVVGKHVRLLGDKDWREVIGVIPDVRAYDLQRNAPEWIEGTVYLPYNASATSEDARVCESSRSDQSLYGKEYPAKGSHNQRIF